MRAAVLAAALLASLPAAAAHAETPSGSSGLLAVQLGLAGLLFLLATRTDLRSGMIPNRLVLAAGLAGLGLHLARAALDEVALGAFTLNAALAAGIAVALWLKDVMPAGDAKLVMAAALAFPIDAYPVELVPALFPAIVPLALAFLLPALAAVPSALRRRKAVPLPTLQALIEAGGGFSLFFLLLYALSTALGARLGIGTVIAAIALAELIELPFRKARWFPVALLGIVGAGSALLALLPAFASGLATAAVVRAAREAVRGLLAAETRRVPVGRARPGMVLADGTAEGLTARQLASLRRRGRRTLEVRREVPFAPWLSLGFLAVALIQLGHAAGIL
jgi:Flp pilus assembly protein protease CpaA